jgi:sulfhydrogenase subunit beta (sulfur reductase)
MNQNHQKAVLERKDLGQMFDVLRRRSYAVLGPTLKEQAIVYEELQSADDLPIGWTDEQSCGTYRLRQRNDEAVFGFNLGPSSWKRFLYPPVIRLWSANRNEKVFTVVEDHQESPAYALFGVRACELAAIGIQDKILMNDPYADPAYKQRRKRNFIVAVHCMKASPNCFCTSMNSGPKAASGYDLVLTEIIEPSHHYFLAEAGTDLGVEILQEVPTVAATDEQITNADHILAKTAAQIRRKLNTDDIRNLLLRNLEHRRWDEAASRCLSCANCTMVCPTCFCATVEDTSDLTGRHAERWRKWDSCFSVNFSYIHGGGIRPSVKSRYRQWVTHKFANWFDQFGFSGCVGCGRCITWCPAGIDLTEELNEIRHSETKHALTHNEEGSS